MSVCLPFNFYSTIETIGCMTIGDSRQPFSDQFGTVNMFPDSSVRPRMTHTLKPEKKISPNLDSSHNSGFLLAVKSIEKNDVSFLCLFEN